MKDQKLILQIYIEQLNRLFGQAAKSRNPALFLYRHDARTLLFMAESLMRLLHRMEDNKRTADGLKVFKKLEDLLGVIEDEDHFIHLFSRRKDVKENEVDYFIKRRDKSLAKLNKKLVKKDFYGVIFGALSREFKINFNRPSLVSELRRQMKIQLQDAFDLYRQHPVKFTSLEEQVHEMRRKLRWLSIYAQSLQGLVKLEDDPQHYAWEKKFVPERSPDSRYNKIIKVSGLKKQVAFNSKAFYALNFLIEKLGEIKDRAIAIEALSQAIQKTGASGPGVANRRAISQLHLNYNLPELFEEAHALVKSFFIKYGIHKKLIK